MEEPVRYQVGDIQIAVICDGYIKLDAGAVMGLIPRVMWEPIIGRENIDTEHRMRLSLNCMVVRSGDEVLLVDTGMGNKVQGTARERGFPGEYGQLLQGLDALGLGTADITVVANTHLHADHCGWNTIGGPDGTFVPTFPNARYFIQAGEYEVARHPNERTRGTYFAENFEPLETTGQLELVEGETELIPGVRFWPTPGHTADHASIALTSKGQTAIYTGDLVHHAVQVERPAWIPAFDILPLVSLETKKMLAERALRENALLICVHNPFPGAGRLTERDGRRTFVSA
ncbi:MAG TPA: MBL fold metallo-hydrolase [Tepidiformaceae bacterium]|nr:MBL fold metallo-hydrolase [Tepidiformaceae bacterium]